MANSKSAEKRIKINERNRLKNRFYKSSIRTSIKGFFKNLENYEVSNSLEDKQKLQEALNLVYSLIDKGTNKNVLHKNTAARKKAQLATYLKTLPS